MASSLQRALQYHEAGELTNAAQLYQDILIADPGHADAYHLLGVLMHQTGQHGVAAELISQAIRLNHCFAPYHNNLGNALLALGRRDDARASFHQSLRLQKSADTYVNLATLDFGEGKLVEAKKRFKAALQFDPKRLESLVGLGKIAMTERKFAVAKRLLEQALSIDPNCVSALNALGHFYMGENNCDKAEEHYIRAREHTPEGLDAHIGLGNLYMQMQRYEAAAKSYRKAYELFPTNHAIVVLLGTAYLMEENSDLAINLFQRAIELDEGHPGSHHLLGSAFVLGGNFGRALACFERSLSLDGSQHEALNGMGTAYDGLGEYSRAQIAFESALALEPRTAVYLLNVGINRGRLRDRGAVEFLDQAIALEPTDPRCHIAMGETLLSFGDYGRGFIEYEWRWRSPSFSRQHRQYDAPLWNGSSLSGRTILLHAEQGLGDTVQFVRFVPQVALRGGTIILVVPQALLRLCEFLECVGVCLPQDVSPLPAFDVHCPLLSLPAMLGTLIETIPQPIDFSVALNDSSIRPTRSQGSLNVGLAWAGNPKHKRDSLRSYVLATLLPLRQVSRCVFYNLQKDVPQRDDASLEYFGMRGFWENCHDFLDTARAMKELDLVICVDTAVAHLAATVGKEVWLILPEAPDWRWGKTEDTSPWYPTMKLFRKNPGETAENVVVRLVNALQKYVAIRENDRLTPVANKSSFNI